MVTNQRNGSQAIQLGAVKSMILNGRAEWRVQWPWLGTSVAPPRASAVGRRARGLGAGLGDGWPRASVAGRRARRLARDSGGGSPPSWPWSWASVAPCGPWPGVSVGPCGPWGGLGGPLWPLTVGLGGPLWPLAVGLRGGVVARIAAHNSESRGVRHQAPALTVRHDEPLAGAVP